MKKSFIFSALVVAAAVVLPFFLGTFTLRTATDILIFAILASSWNIIGGYTGYASFGNIVFVGLGAYATAIFMNILGLGFFPSLLLSGLLGGVYGYLTGLPILRLKGHYFAIATLGLAEATKALVQNLGITEGNSGMYLPMPELSIDASYRFFFYVSLGVLVLLLLVTWLILKSKLGYGLIAIREDEDAANSMGINTTRFKCTAFGLSGIFSGMAGAIYAYQQGFIKPEPVFTVASTVKMIVMAVFGGIGSLWGPTIGAVVIEVIDNFLSAHFLVIHTIFFGSIVILVILFAPKGIYDIFSGRKKVGLAYFLENIRKNRV
ncbi:MAG: branched-chain amino acid ABC transporter permease [Desulfuromonadales bacterium]